MRHLPAARRSKQYPHTILEVEVRAADLVSGISLQGPSNCQKIRKFMDQRGWVTVHSSPNMGKINIGTADFFKVDSNETG
ncbi:hypothetical protein CDAR_79771 [Caerostris darwini]|uniref:Uncharacterized protein n=1 Tax=Caerostris darwini TaxID=1538125 RepID=A0AAV4WA96_9ARAC|nr:hypothetical protein CDAR_79771 [Caerostris darwini]